MSVSQSQRDRQDAVWKGSDTHTHTSIHTQILHIHTYIYAYFYTSVKSINHQVGDFMSSHLHAYIHTCILDWICLDWNVHTYICASSSSVPETSHVVAMVRAYEQMTASVKSITALGVSPSGDFKPSLVLSVQCSLGLPVLFHLNRACSALCGNRNKQYSVDRHFLCISKPVYIYMHFHNTYIYTLKYAYIHNVTNLTKTRCMWH